MDTQTRSTIRRFLGNRTAVAAAGAVGFMLGAGGLVAAQAGADDAAPVTTQVDTTDVTVTSVDDSTPTSVDDSTPTSVDDSTPTSVDDSTPTSVDDSTPTSIDDSTPTSVDDGDDDDNTSTSIDDDDGDDDDDNTSTSIDDDDGDDDDDNTSTSIDDDDGDDDDDETSTSVPAALPAAFTETYQSNGGSISVSWSGTTFSIDSISPAGDYEAEIEDNSWDKVRVDFDFVGGNSGSGHNDTRIEVRLHDGSIRVRID